MNRLLLLFSVAFSFPGSLVAQTTNPGNANTNGYTIDIPWSYVFRPGHPGWGEVTNSYEAVQVPEIIYKRMTTSALAETCLNFPFQVDIFATGHSEESFDFIVREFPPFRELFARPDVGPVLVRKYAEIEVEDVISMAGNKKYNFVSFTFFHQVIKRNEVLGKLDESAARQLAGTAYRNMKTLHDRIGITATTCEPLFLFAKLLVTKKPALPTYPPGAAIDASTLARMARGTGARDGILKLLETYKPLDPKDPYWRPMAEPPK